MGGQGKEGDWECSGCGNRNYAFRCFCNRCKQPRLLVDTKTPPDSKWLPRIGDWICSGCTNNNYASRESCKKCGQPKEVAAMPALTVPGASVTTHPSYFVRSQGNPGQHLNSTMFGSGGLQQPIPLSSNWPLRAADSFRSQPADGYGFQSASTWPLAGNDSSGVAYVNQRVTVPEGFRSGDWICTCGFHNYSSRTECKKCNAAIPPAASSSLVSTAVTALGVKRLASEEFAHDWDKKRLNAGHQIYPVVESTGGSFGNQPTSAFPAFSVGNTPVAAHLPVNLHMSSMPVVPTLFGKGAKQWRDGDWMCKNCNNHNYASRSQCNRCKSERAVIAQPVTAA